MTKGLDIKFKQDDPTYSTSNFADNVFRHLKRCGMDTVFFVFRHLKRCGMDTVFYSPSITYPSEYLNICTSHSMFENYHVNQIVQDNIAAGFYDEYDLANLSDSVEFLLIPSTLI
jgi:hypothetical protein